MQTPISWKRLVGDRMLPVRLDFGVESVLLVPRVRSDLRLRFLDRREHRESRELKVLRDNRDQWVLPLQYLDLRESEDFRGSEVYKGFRDLRLLLLVRKETEEIGDPLEHKEPTVEQRRPVGQVLVGEMELTE